MMPSSVRNASIARIVTLSVATAPVVCQDINLRAKIVKNVLHSLFLNLGYQSVKVVMRLASPVPSQAGGAHLVVPRHTLRLVTAPA